MMDPTRSIGIRRPSENFFSDRASSSIFSYENIKKITRIALPILAIMIISASAGYGVAYLLHYRFKQCVTVAVASGIAGGAASIMRTTYKYFKMSKASDLEEEDETVVVKKSWLSRFKSKNPEEFTPKKV